MLKDEPKSPPCFSCKNIDLGSVFKYPKDHIVFCKLFSDPVSRIGKDFTSQHLLIKCSYFDNID